MSRRRPQKRCGRSVYVFPRRFNLISGTVSVANDARDLLGYMLFDSSDDALSFVVTRFFNTS